MSKKNHPSWINGESLMGMNMRWVQRHWCKDEGYVKLGSKGEDKKENEREAREEDMIEFKP